MPITSPMTPGRWNWCWAGSTRWSIRKPARTVEVDDGRCGDGGGSGGWQARAAPWRQGRRIQRRWRVPRVLPVRAVRARIVHHQPLLQPVLGPDAVSGAGASAAGIVLAVDRDRYVLSLQLSVVRSKVC